MKTQSLALALVAMLASSLAAQDADRAPGRLRYLEGDVVLQRASDPGSEEASTNAPFLPGDRLWTQGTGRVEVQFADGSILRLDSRAKLDYDNLERDRVVLKLWSGGAILRRVASGDGLDFTVVTPDAVIDVNGEGRYRLDVDSTETKVDVIEGQATLDAGGRRATLQSGERLVARDSGLGDVEIAYADTEFDYWSEDRDRAVTRTGRSREYLPAEVRPYEDDFDTHGDWEYADAEVGHVWRPRVTSLWTPYNDGGWVWTDYGWTWVPNETWGWPAFHYGRWGHSIRLGWYWIPGNRWSPAWVSWAVSDRYVGWCPMGYRDRPLYVNVNINVRDRNRFRGHATPRSTWTYANRGDMGRRQGGRARWTRPDAVTDLKVLDTPGVRLDRKFQPTRAIGRINRGPGDVVPELQRDPKYLPMGPRARPRNGQIETHAERGAGNASASPAGQPRRGQTGDRADRNDTGRVWRTRPETAQPATPRETSQRQEERGRVWRTRPDSQTKTPAQTTPQTQPGNVRTQDRPPVFRTAPERKTEAAQPERGVRERRNEADESSREVMRRFFRPAEEKRGGSDRGASDREGARPRGTGRAPEVRRAEPQRKPPAAQAPPPQAPRQERAAPRREKPPREKQN